MKVAVAPRRRPSRRSPARGATPPGLSPESVQPESSRPASRRMLPATTPMKRSSLLAQHPSSQHPSAGQSSARPASPTKRSAVPRATMQAKLVSWVEGTVSKLERRVSAQGSVQASQGMELKILGKELEVMFKGEILEFTQEIELKVRGMLAEERAKDEDEDVKDGKAGPTRPKRHSVQSVLTSDATSDADSNTSGDTLLGIASHRVGGAPDEMDLQQRIQSALTSTPVTVAPVAPVAPVRTVSAAHKGRNSDDKVGGRPGHGSTRGAARDPTCGPRLNNDSDSPTTSPASEAAVAVEAVVAAEAVAAAEAAVAVEAAAAAAAAEAAAAAAAEAAAIAAATTAATAAATTAATVAATEAAEAAAAEASAAATEASAASAAVAAEQCRLDELSKRQVDDRTAASSSMATLSQTLKETRAELEALSKRVLGEKAARRAKAVADQGQVDGQVESLRETMHIGDQARRGEIASDRAKVEGLVERLMKTESRVEILSSSLGALAERRVPSSSSSPSGETGRGGGEERGKKHQKKTKGGQGTDSTHEKERREAAGRANDATARMDAKQAAASSSYSQLVSRLGPSQKPPPPPPSPGGETARRGGHRGRGGGGHGGDEGGVDSSADAAVVEALMQRVATLESRENTGGRGARGVNGAANNKAAVVVAAPPDETVDTVLPSFENPLFMKKDTRAESKRTKGRIAALEAALEELTATVAVQQQAMNEAAQATEMEEEIERQARRAGSIVDVSDIGDISALDMSQVLGAGGEDEGPFYTNNQALMSRRRVKEFHLQNISRGGDGKVAGGEESERGEGGEPPQKPQKPQPLLLRPPEEASTEESRRCLTAAELDSIDGSRASTALKGYGGLLDSIDPRLQERLLGVLDRVAALEMMVGGGEGGGGEGGGDDTRFAGGLEVAEPTSGSTMLTGSTELSSFDHDASTQLSVEETETDVSTVLSVLTSEAGSNVSGDSMLGIAPHLLSVRHPHPRHHKHHTHHKHRLASDGVGGVSRASGAGAVNGGNVGGGAVGGAGTAVAVTAAAGAAAGASGAAGKPLHLTINARNNAHKLLVVSRRVVGMETVIRRLVESLELYHQEMVGVQERQDKQLEQQNQQLKRRSQSTPERAARNGGGGDWLDHHGLENVAALVHAQVEARLEEMVDARLGQRLQGVKELGEEMGRFKDRFDEWQTTVDQSIENLSLHVKLLLSDDPTGTSGSRANSPNASCLKSRTLSESMASQLSPRGKSALGPRELTLAVVRDDGLALEVRADIFICEGKILMFESFNIVVLAQ